MSLKNEIAKINEEYGQQSVTHSHYSVLDPEPMSFPGDVAYSGEEVVTWWNPKDGEAYSLSATTAKMCGLKFN